MSTPNKIKHCQIHLAEPFRTTAARASFQVTTPVDGRGMVQAQFRALLEDWKVVNAVPLALQEEFTGPHFHDIDGVYNEDGFCVVVLHDGTQYCYPHHTVARVKNYTTDEAPRLKAV